jgi:hypothetical protein
VKSDQTLARERRAARPVAFAAFAAVAAFIAAIAINQGGALADADTDSQLLVSYEEDSDALLLGAIVQAVGMVLVIAPLFYLFQAASARSEAVRPSLIGVTVAGPLFLAVGTILRWVAFDQAAGEFAAPGGGLGIPVGEYAEDLIQERATFDASQGFTFAGTLGLVVAVVYVSLHAMRTGLLTRFWGSLGMALGVSVLFLGFLGLLVYILALGLLIGGWWVGGRPAAWETGTAVPWPRPGEEPGSGEAAPEPGDPAAEPAAPAGSEAGSTPAPQKRKRRRS